MSPSSPAPLAHDRLIRLAEGITDAVQARLPGQGTAARALAAAYMAGGHALLQGVPGIGKTLLARTFAAALGLDFQRVQFTPDLMPADLLGTNVFRPASGTFELVRGPVFTHVLMGDEINRTPPKTQAALLEAMQEMQVTIDGETHPLPPDFFVIATQNPIELEGTYPLPEAQLDRFLVRVDMGPPERDAELEIYRRAVAGTLAGWSGDDLPAAVPSAEEARALRHASRGVHVAEELLGYLADLAGAVRRSPHVELAVSPRGALALLELGRAHALLAGRDFLTPDDLKGLLAPCWSHRLLLTPESELEGRAPRQVLEEAAASVPVPR